MRTSGRGAITAVVVLALHGAAAADEGAGKTAKPAAVARRFVGLMAAGKHEEATALFDATMKRAMPAAKLEATWAAVEKQAGPFKRQAAVRETRQGRFRIVLVTCEFGRAWLDVKVVFDRAGAITGLWFQPAAPPTVWTPPAYVNREAFTERAVTVGTGAWALPGTLSAPKGDGPFPGIVLVHGSGPQDRDETIGPNKPFRDLAWGLASRGVAVLRYEKRTKAHGGRMTGPITVKEETVDDAVAAAALLRAAKEADPKRLFVLGHSLGGMLVPRIAARGPAVAGFIIMAGTARPLEEVVVEQVTYIAGLDGTIDAEEKARIADLTARAARVKDPALSPETPASDLPLGIPAAYWLDLRGYDPPEAAKTVKRPMLILQGGRDYQVTATDFNRWKAALAGRDDVAFKWYPALNHLFAAGKGTITPDEYARPAHVAAAVIDDIAAWVKKR